MIPDNETLEVWFLTGSQPLYGQEVLDQVAAHSQEIVAALNASNRLSVPLVLKAVLTTSEEIYRACMEANNTPTCAGVVLWMHTFSPANNWIAGLTVLRKPLAHLHTQYNRDLPWNTIDMDFMNLNQSAHGDREFGHLMTRMRLKRKVIVGHWQDVEVQEDLGRWIRSACAWADAQQLTVARLGDNMRSVTVTEGDKVQAQLQLGYAVQTYGVGELAALINQVSDAETDALIAVYESMYVLAPDLRRGGARHNAVRDAARIEIGLRYFLKQGGFKAFTTTFEDLHGLTQLPGLAVQRLMAEGYGFGAEGDWKSAALLRSMKVMAHGLSGGTSFMEDYTYHLQPGAMKVLGAHMLEICPSIADNTPSLEVHPLQIGNKSDPARLVFNTAAGRAINASLVTIGNRFRLVVNTVDVVAPDAPLTQLPVARAVWIPRPNLKVAAAAWIYAGGSHHTVFSQSLTADYLDDYAEIAGIELIHIDEHTDLRQLRNALRWNDAAYQNGL
jgi:L-arabinose isomerase